MNAQQTATKKATKIDWYARFVMSNLTVSSDDNGLYCEVMSERIEGLRYRVDMDEMTMTATRCQCAATRPCKHMNMVDAAFAHRASQVTCEVEVGKWYIVDHSQQVFLIDGKWLCSCGDTETCQHREAVKRRLDPIIETPAEETATPEPVAMAVEPKRRWNHLQACWCDAVTGKPAATLGGIPYWDANKGFIDHPEGKIWDQYNEEWVEPAMPDMMKAALTSNKAFSVLR